MQRTNRECDQRLRHTAWTTAAGSLIPALPPEGETKGTSLLCAGKTLVSVHFPEKTLGENPGVSSFSRGKPWCQFIFQRKPWQEKDELTPSYSWQEKDELTPSYSVRSKKDPLICRSSSRLCHFWAWASRR
jgi:hypothetical protein